MFSLWNRDAVSREGGEGNNQVNGESVHLALYKYDSCPFCQRVFGAIDDVDVNIEYRDIRTDMSHRNALSARTGRTTVPCLFVNDVPMFESGDIANWLRNNFGSSKAASG
jgi:glutaredoxin